MAAASIEIIAGTGGIMNTDIWATIDEHLHEDTPTLGASLVDMVDELTPIRTGALVMDITYEAYTSPGGYGMEGSDLVYIYAQDLAQEAYWNRIYVQYQEGGPLGVPTYTNDPHQMFFDVARGDGLALVTVWAMKNIQEALDECVAGAGVPWSG